MDCHNDFCPSRPLTSVEIADSQALSLCYHRHWALASFAALFDPTLTKVLLVQLGDYAKPIYEGNPWTLPGGAAHCGEVPSVTACRELYEEANIVVTSKDLRCVAWFPRPYYKPARSDTVGELLLLFAALTPLNESLPRPSPPETIDAAFVDFSFDDWLAVPSRGTGLHKLQPLPRHWTYWAYLARLRLAEPARDPILWVYSSRESMRLPPWPAGHSA
ncbi:MAG: NUDIX hydrolase [Pirellulaceae bacterium]